MQAAHFLMPAPYDFSRARNEIVASRRRILRQAIIGRSHTPSRRRPSFSQIYAVGRISRTMTHWRPYLVISHGWLMRDFDALLRAAAAGIIISSHCGAAISILLKAIPQNERNEVTFSLSSWCPSSESGIVILKSIAEESLIMPLHHILTNTYNLSLASMMRQRLSSILVLFSARARFFTMKYAALDLIPGPRCN